VGYTDQRNAQATVEAPYPFGLEDGACASQHRGICALRSAVRRDHAYFENPDGVRQCRGRGSRQRTREKVVTCRWTAIRPILPRGEGVLEARLEEEERSPARGVSDEIWRQAAVERGDRVRS
jgi:hypothetical protein